MQDKEIVYSNFKRLQETSEWKVFVKHIQETIDIHKEASLNYIGKDREIDAQRQFWMSEGLLEAIDEPKRFIFAYDTNPMNFVKKNFKTIKDYLQK